MIFFKSNAFKARRFSFYSIFDRSVTHLYTIDWRSSGWNRCNRDVSFENSSIDDGAMSIRHRVDSLWCGRRPDYWSWVRYESSAESFVYVENDVDRISPNKMKRRGANLSFQSKPQDSLCCRASRRAKRSSCRWHWLWSPDFSRSVAKC